MTWHQRQLGAREFAVLDVQVSATNAARVHLHQDIAHSWHGHWSGLVQPKGCMRCIQHHCAHSVDIVIGGNGSQTGARELQQRGAAVIGVASTIDNDLYGTEVTIGSTTAIDVALEAIDRLRVTAASLKRAFLVEVMGRQSGHIALTAGIAGGAECIIIPEVETTPEGVAQQLRDVYARGKSHAIAVVAEGAKYNAEALARYFRNTANASASIYESRGWAISNAAARPASTTGCSVPGWVPRQQMRRPRADRGSCSEYALERSPARHSRRSQGNKNRPTSACSNWRASSRCRCSRHDATIRRNITCKGVIRCY